ncbi:MAG: secF, partial [Microbacterium sp.]|nr:secF [Microbacterium sp.]
LFIGIIVGTYSTIFIASPMYAQLRENEPKIKESDAKKTAAAEKRRREVDAAEANV